MRKILLAVPLILIAAFTAHAQCTFTQVSGTVTDPNGLPYSNGTITAQLQPASMTPTCGGATIGGTNSTSLDINGSFTMYLAANTAITPSGTHWQFTVQGSANLPPPVGKGTQTFTTGNITITGSTQSLTTTLNALATALTVTFGGSSTPCITQALSFQFNNGGAFGCVPDFTFTAPHTMTLGASGIFTITGTLGLSGAAGFTLPTSAGFASTSTVNLGIDSTNLNLTWWNGAQSLIGLGIVSVPVSGDVAGFTVSSSNVKVQDLGAPAGGGLNFLKCTPNGFVSGDYFAVNGSGICAELTPGLTPVSITASGTTTMLSSYRGQAVTAASTSGAQTFALPDGTTTGFTANFYFRVCNHGTVGDLSITNNGGSYTFNAAASPYTLHEGYCADISNNSTSTGWRLALSPGLLTAGAGISITQSQFGETIAATGSSGVTAVDLTGQAANISATTIVTPGANGFYFFSCYVTTTQAATTSSILPICAALWTDADTAVAQAQEISNSSSANTVGTIGPSAASGAIPPAPAAIYVKGGTAIQYRTQSYNSVGATPLQYAIHVRVQGPF